jgi:SAM-dependent methyltransferase
MPIEVFFRTEDEMSELELIALQLCSGKTLDIGAGVGGHSLILQERGRHITALEISEGACKIMASRGVKRIINQDLFTYQSEKYDTLLLMMNGIGLIGEISKLQAFLDHCDKLLSIGGQILFDSSDISYLYQDIAMPLDSYFGELKYRYEYKAKLDEWFDWLYIDMQMFKQNIENSIWKFDLLYEDGMDQYLGKLTRK